MKPLDLGRRTERLNEPLFRPCDMPNAMILHFTGTPLPRNAKCASFLTLGFPRQTGAGVTFGTSSATPRLGWVNNARSFPAQRVSCPVSSHSSKQENIQAPLMPASQQAWSCGVPS